MDLKNDIEKAKELICGYNHSKFYEIYPFATENISGYLNRYNLKEKSILSVGSSNDQIINAYFLGAKQVTSFDINPFTEYYFELKKAAIKVFSYEEFLNFFCYYNYPKTFIKNRNAFSYDKFLKISKYLSKESFVFWNTLFDRFSGLKIRKNMFSKDENLFRAVIKNNLYLDKENFYMLKNTIDGLKPLFINCDFRDISGILNDKYDYILLSNVLTYMETMYEYPLKGFSEDIKKLFSFLNDNGVMLVAYLYDFHKNTRVLPYWDLIYHKDKIFECFKEYDFTLESFTSSRGYAHNDFKFNDSVYVLKK